MGRELSTAGKQDSVDAKSWQSNTYYGLGILGYALYLTLVLSILVNFDFSLSTDSAYQSALLFARLSFIVAFVITLFVVWLFSDVFSKRPGAYTLTFMSLLTLLPILSGVVKSLEPIAAAGGGV